MKKDQLETFQKKLNKVMTFIEDKNQKLAQAKRSRN